MATILSVSNEITN